MTSKIFLSLVLHNHQPVGQFGFVNEHSVIVAYEPFVALMEQHPHVRCGIHFTGSLLDYLIAEQQPLLKRIRALAERQQLEVLSGAYYEPILITLPDSDKIGQIRKLSKTVEDVFGTKPRGMWLAERVWEPHLVRPIAEAGIEYVIIDDTHFEAVGYNKEKDLFGYFVSEEQGYTVRVFPTLSHLRYAIPWDTVPNLIAWLREQSEEVLPNFQPKLAFMGDDGEKFGVWPGTYEHNWGETQYMEGVFSAIEENHDWLETIRPMDYIDQYPALGRVYLPTASYFEMGQWSLPPARFRELKRIKKEFTDQGREDVLHYLRGSIWRNFMVKYDEVNHMNKRMLHVAEKVHAMPDGPAKEQALDALWRSQANDAYWHGLFGGIYLFNFRVANYANLIAAEALAEGQQAALAVRQFDFNKDSTHEVVLSDAVLNAIWKPNSGGMMLELDSRPLRYNILNIMTRYEEGYHEEIREGAGQNALVTPEIAAQSSEWELRDAIRVKEAGIDRYLLADWYRRGAFIDHFLRADVNLLSFYRSFYGEQGDFVNLPYEADVQAGDQQARVSLSRSGHVWVDNRHVSVKVTKEFSFRHGEDRFTCAYTVMNQSDSPVDMRFAVELASGFDGGQDMTYCHMTINGSPNRYSLAELNEFQDVTTHTSVTSIRSLQLTTSVDQPSTLWVFPLETVTNSEAGYERGYQGTVYVHIWDLHLEPNAEWHGNITQQVSAYNP